MIARGIGTIPAKHLFRFTGHRSRTNCVADVPPSGLIRLLIVCSVTFLEAPTLRGNNGSCIFWCGIWDNILG